MTPLRWLAALLLALALTGSEARAQVVIAGSFGSGRKARLTVGVLVGGYLPGGYVGGPYGYGPPYGYVGPYGSTSIRQVTVIYTPPLFAPPPPFLDPLDDDLGPPPRRLPPPRDQPPMDRPRLPAPEPRKPEPKPAPKPDPKPAPMPEPKLDLPLKDPKLEAARLIDLGQAAFADQEYGRARERFAQALQANPDEPRASFLLAQALLALGKYHEALDAIHAGLARNPDWPAAAFRPLELYGDHVQDYTEHLRRLDATLNRHPGDPVLLFLNAYLMWFDGRKDEARPLFRRALARNADRGDVERFLRVGPGPEL